LIAPKLAALPRYAGASLKRKPGELKKLLATIVRTGQPGGILAKVERSATQHDDEPGVVLDCEHKNKHQHPFKRLPNSTFYKADSGC
jgi:hypothetical protein